MRGTWTQGHVVKEDQKPACIPPHPCPSAAIRGSFVRKRIGSEEIGKNDSDDKHFNQMLGGGRIRNGKAPPRSKK